MHCPACSKTLTRRGNNLFCENSETEFPVQTTQFIDEAILQYSEGKNTILSRDALRSDWYCINCGGQLYYQGFLLVCCECEFSIRNILQHLMQNRVGHSGAL